MRISLLSFLLLAAVAPAADADLKMPSVYGSHMVLQRGAPIRFLGKTAPGHEVRVSLKGEGVAAESVGAADDTGHFDVSLPEMQAGGPYTVTVTADETKTFEDVLIGEVWVCSGQSNMQWPVSNSNDADLEIMTARYPQIRLISVPQVGVQEPQDDFNGEWKACSPETVKDFSAVGYYFGRRLHQALDVPIGLIDNAWGGSACEAWIRRDLLEEDDRFTALMDQWKKTEATYDHEAAVAKYREALARWKETGRGRQPRAPRNPLAGQHRPGNLYCGVLHPIIGYTIRGTIWYQGESNAGRAYQYRDLFPMMISLWRDEWKQGDFPFYWVQLADYRAEADAPGESDWAELREAQTMTLSRLPNTGEAVILNLGEASDIHPRNKQDVADRLARLALANDYGIEIAAGSPRYESADFSDGKAVLTFTNVGGGLDTFDVTTPVGFTIASADGPFVTATARITSSNTIEVSSPEIEQPAAVRYAWADNPVCNVQSREGLPLTPFRTDDRPGITAGK